MAILSAATAVPCQLPGLIRDPVDGQMDLSDWLLDHKGFLPVPILITEPALGYGAGLAVAFFNQSLAEGARAEGGFVPPLIAGAAAFYTSGGSYGVGVGLFYPIRQDQYRYVGALGGASLDLDFYGFDPDGPLADQPIAYTIDPVFTFHRLQARVPGTDLFLGTQYVYVRTKTAFAGGVPPEIESRELEMTLGGLGARIEFDARDNLLDARRGIDISANAMWFGPSFGGDDSFSTYDLQGLLYGQPSSRWGYGLRVDAGFASEETPFFAKPYLSMRGLPSLKYLNNITLLGEAELRYSIDARWTMIAFGGGGRVAEDWDEIGGASGVGAGGAGFRYLIARKLGLGTGLDFAFGSDGDFAFYVQAGSAWR